MSVALSSWPTARLPNSSCRAMDTWSAILSPLFCPNSTMPCGGKRGRSFGHRCNAGAIVATASLLRRTFGFPPTRRGRGRSCARQNFLLLSERRRFITGFPGCREVLSGYAPGVSESDWFLPYSGGPTEHGGGPGDYSMNRSFLLRSEERRVGKEC